MDLTRIKSIPIKDVAIKLGIAIKKNGNSMCFTGHDKNTPSLSFYEKNNTWKCFGACDKGGDNISLVSEYLQIDFIESIKWFECYGIYQTSVKRKIKIRPNKIRKIEVTQEEGKPDSEIYEWLISKCGEVKSPVGIKYFEDHGITRQTIKANNIKELINPERAKASLLEKWDSKRLLNSGLIILDINKNYKCTWRGYCLLFPFYNEGKITYIQGRMFNREPKYCNLKGVRSQLYNADKLKNIKSGSRIHICEGIPDALAMESFGFNSVAVVGATAFKKEWVTLFKDLEVVLTPDSDAGGDTFAKHIQNHFNKAGKSIQKMKLPEKNKDVSDVLAKLWRNS